MIGRYYTYARHSIKAEEWRYTEHDELSIGLDNTTSWEGTIEVARVCHQIS